MSWQCAQGSLFLPSAPVHWMRAAFRALASPTWGGGFLVVDPGEAAPWPGWQWVASLLLVVPPPTRRQRSSPHIISTPMLPQNPDSPAHRELLPRTGRLDLSYLLELQIHSPPQRLAVRALLPAGQEAVGQSFRWKINLLLFLASRGRLKPGGWATGGTPLLSLPPCSSPFRIL